VSFLLGHDNDGSSIFGHELHRRVPPLHADHIQNPDISTAKTQREEMVINGYIATKIIETPSSQVIDYIFERNGRLYVLSATHPELFDVVLPTLTFF
jgi:hypothetical protein